MEIIKFQNAAESKINNITSAKIIFFSEEKKFGFAICNGKKAYFNLRGGVSLDLRVYGGLDNEPFTIGLYPSYCYKNILALDCEPKKGEIIYVFSTEESQKGLKITSWTSQEEFEHIEVFESIKKSKCKKNVSIDRTTVYGGQNAYNARAYITPFPKEEWFTVLYHHGNGVCVAPTKRNIFTVLGAGREQYDKACERAISPKFGGTVVLQALSASSPKGYYAWNKEKEEYQSAQLVEIQVNELRVQDYKEEIFVAYSADHIFIGLQNSITGEVLGIEKGSNDASHAYEHYNIAVIGESTGLPIVSNYFLIIRPDWGRQFFSQKTRKIMFNKDIPSYISDDSLVLKEEPFLQGVLRTLKTGQTLWYSKGEGPILRIESGTYDCVIEEKEECVVVYRK